MIREKTEEKGRGRKPTKGGFPYGTGDKWIVPVINDKIWLRTGKRCGGKMVAADIFERVLRRFCPGIGLIFPLRRCIVVFRCGRGGPRPRKNKRVSQFVEATD